MTGTGSSGSSGSNYGVYVVGSTITSGGGAVNVTGTGTANSEAVHLDNNGAITSGSKAPITITADSLFLDTTCTINSGTGPTTIVPLTAGTLIALGGTEVLSGTPLTLGLSAAEIAQITAGTLNIGNTSSGAVAVSTAITFSSPVVNVTTGSGNAITFTETGSLNSSGGYVTLTTSGTGAITSATAATDITAGAGTISLNAGSGGIGASGSPIIVSGTNLDATTSGNSNEFLTAVGSITIDPAGLAAGTGTVELDGGTFTLGNNNLINANANLNVNGATFAVGAFSETVNTVTLTSGTISGTTGLLTSTNTFQLQSGTASAILAGANGLTKTTGGTVTLSGDNTYSGATTVSSGTLLITGSLTESATSDLASTTLGGTGSVQALSISGDLAPGLNGVGTLTANGNVTLTTTNAEFSVQLDGTGAGSSNQLAESGGTVNLGTQTTLVVTQAVPTFTGQTFTIISGAGTITGTFAGLSEGATFAVGNESYSITYVGGTGHDVVLTALGTASTISLVDNGPNPATPQQAISLTATVSGSGPTPSGTVILEDGSNGNAVVGSGALSGGTVTFNVSPGSLAIGSHNLFAVYAGDSTYLGSQSGISTQTIDASTTTSVISSQQSVTYGTAVTFTATVTSGSTPPSGSVEFYDDTTDVDLGPGLLQSSSGDASVWTLTTSPSQLSVTSSPAAQVIRAAYTSTGLYMSGSGTLTGGETITPLALTVSGLTAANKVYNKTTSATLISGSATLSGVLSGDTVTLVTTGAAGTFATPNVGNGIIVTVSGLTLGGAEAGDYSLDQPNTTATITAAPLTVTGITAANKLYDQTTHATLNTSSAALSGVLTGDNVNLSVTGAAGLFASQNVGTDITVTVSGLSLSGAQVGDYSLTQPTLTANITAVPLTVSGVTANNKVYDSTTSAILNTGDASLVGVLSGDTVTLGTTGATGTFASKDVSNGITVTTSGLTLGGAQFSDYTLIQPTTTANITPRPLTITAATDSKTYDQTTGSAASPTITSGTLQGTDTAAFTETFDSPSVGTGKVLTPSGVVSDGDGGNDYTYTFVPQSTGTITPAPVSVTGVMAANKLYDGTTTATLSTTTAALVGVVPGDIVTLNTAAATGAFASPNPGNGIAVTVSGLMLTGPPAGDYSLIQPTTSADILSPPPASPPLASQPILVGGLPNGTVDVYTESNGSYTLQETLQPFGNIPTDVRTAVGDINGDGIPDYIFAIGPSPTDSTGATIAATAIEFKVMVLSGAPGNSVLVLPFDPFLPNPGGSPFTAGGFVSAGDFLGNGRDQIVVSPDQQGGPRIAIYDMNGAATAGPQPATPVGVNTTEINPGSGLTRINNFLSVNANFRGGARTAVGDLNGDGIPDLAIAAGFGGGPAVLVINGTKVPTTTGFTPSDDLIGNFLPSTPLCVTGPIWQSVMCSVMANKSLSSGLGLAVRRKSRCSAASRLSLKVRWQQSPTRWPTSPRRAWGQMERGSGWLSRQAGLAIR